jgi:hypothetical protein
MVWKFERCKNRTLHLIILNHLIFLFFDFFDFQLVDQEFD